MFLCGLLLVECLSVLVSSDSAPNVSTDRCFEEKSNHFMEGGVPIYGYKTLLDCKDLCNRTEKCLAVSWMAKTCLIHMKVQPLVKNVTSDLYLIVECKETVKNEKADEETKNTEPKKDPATEKVTTSSPFIDDEDEVPIMERKQRYTGCFSLP